MMSGRAYCSWRARSQRLPWYGLGGLPVSGFGPTAAQLRHSRRENERCKALLFLRLHLDPALETLRIGMPRSHQDFDSKQELTQHQFLRQTSRLCSSGKMAEPQG